MKLACSCMKVRCNVESMKRVDKQNRQLRFESLEARRFLAADLSTGLVGYWPLNSTSETFALNSNKF